MQNDFKQQSKDFYAQHRVLSILILIIGGLIILSTLWYIVLPVAALWYIWKKSSFQKKRKIQASVGVLVLMILGFSINAYAVRAPVLSLSNPQDNSSIQAPVVNIQGKVSPSDATVTINGTTVETKDGVLDYKFPLNKDTENNQINIVASNAGKTVSKTLVVTRIFTDQEKSDIAARALKAKQEADAVAAKQKADQTAYDNSPAGRLCKKHTDWSKSDCESVANKEMWIGMTIDMLKAERGLPNHVNKSNYGAGDQWQWCWENYDYSQNCFYGGSDGIITSYN